MHLIGFYVHCIKDILPLTGLLIEVFTADRKQFLIGVEPRVIIGDDQLDNSLRLAGRQLEIIGVDIHILVKGRRRHFLYSYFLTGLQQAAKVYGRTGLRP